MTPIVPPDLIAALAAPGWSTAAGAILAVALVLLILQREIAACGGDSLRLVARNLIVIIVPLLVIRSNVMMPMSSSGTLTPKTSRPNTSLGLGHGTGVEMRTFM